MRGRGGRLSLIWKRIWAIYNRESDEEEDFRDDVRAFVPRQTTIEEILGSGIEDNDDKDCLLGRCTPCSLGIGTRGPKEIRLAPTRSGSFHTFIPRRQHPMTHNYTSQNTLSGRGGEINAHRSPVPLEDFRGGLAAEQSKGVVEDGLTCWI